VLGFTIAVNALSAVCTAAAFGIAANLLARWTRDPLVAVAGAVCAGTMSTVWLNATETEVYSVALLGAMVLLWTANRAHETGERRWALLCAYGCGVAWALHLTTLLTLPAALYFIFTRIRATPRTVIAALVLTALGASAVLFLLVRAPHDPAINQGNPSTLRALIDVVQRHQYDVAPLWPRRAPLWLQFGNVFEYADWQVALGLHQEPGPAWGRTVATLCFAGAGTYGCLVHRRLDRRSWFAMMVLFATVTVGVAIYLNLLAGPSYGYGILPNGAAREARERDYFFTLAFVCWGLWAGMGWITLGRTLRARWMTSQPLSIVLRVVMPIVTPLVIFVAALPIALNWSANRFERRDQQQEVEREARETLQQLPPRAVMLADGDNDTYPLWYMQEVQGLRRDVTIVTIPMLYPVWYRQELLRRHALIDSATARSWIGLRSMLATIRAHANTQGRPVVHSPIADSVKAGVWPQPN